MQQNADLDDASRLAAPLLRYYPLRKSPRRRCGYYWATVEPTVQEIMNRILAASVLATFVLFASSASAGPITLGSVGFEDRLIGGYNLGNSDGEEREFLFDYLETLGEEYNPLNLSYQKIDIDGPDSFVEVVDEPAASNLWAIDFARFSFTNPLVFLVKFGNAEYDHYLYENLESLRFGVVDLADINAAKGKITISSISHTSVAVPEPATLSLLVLGAAGAGVASRKRRRRVA